MDYVNNKTEHKHSKTDVVDAVVLFKIDPITRAISKTSEHDVILVRNDHNSERYRISLPRYIDGHDMSLCDIARVHYINIGAASGVENSDTYEADDLGLIVEDGMDEKDATEVSFTWLVKNTATREHGRLAFAIELTCTSGGNNDGYSWNSGVYSDIIVSDGIHNGNAIIGVYGDILQHWWEKLMGAFGGSIEENSKEPFRFWIGTQAEYDTVVAGNQIITDCVYFITDDNSFDEFASAYTDARIGDIGTDATVKSFVDGRIANTKSDFITYTDNEILKAKDHADNQSSIAKNNANLYTDTRIGDIGTDTTVKSYVDGIASDVKSTFESYADDAADAAYKDAKDYIDGLISESATNGNVVAAMAQAITTAGEYTDDVASGLEENLSKHTGNIDNPHDVTADQVGAYFKEETYNRSEIVDAIDTKINSVSSEYTKKRLLVKKLPGETSTEGDTTIDGAGPVLKYPIWTRKEGAIPSMMQFELYIGSSEPIVFSKSYFQNEPEHIVAFHIGFYSKTFELNNSFPLTLYSVFIENDTIYIGTLGLASGTNSHCRREIDPNIWIRLYQIIE